MAPTENTPLMGDQSRRNGQDGLPTHSREGDGGGGGGGFSLNPHAPPGHPNLVSSLYWLVFNSWLNVMLLFVPLGFVAEFLHWPAVWRFSLNFAAIIPLAKLLGDSTEQVSLKLGQTLGGLLNATFGNAVELIVGIVALIQGQLRIVQTSLIGSILSNILLVLGMSFVAGGLFKRENMFQQTAAQASGSIMTLGCITVAIPAAYQSSQRIGTFFELGHEGVQAFDKDADTLKGLLLISRGTSILLLIIYALYLFFQLKTHSFLYEAEEGDGEDEEEVAMMTPMASIVGLVVVTVITSFNADYLVSAIDETAKEYGIPKAFIGTILLPIVGNAAEHVTSVWMAAKNKMEIAIGVSIGSSIQIAVGVIPALVLVGWAIGQPLTLYFQTFETVVLVASVVLVNLLIMDGRSNYMEGAMLVSLYLVAALAFWASPDQASS